MLWLLYIHPLWSRLIRNLFTICAWLLLLIGYWSLKFITQIPCTVIILIRFPLIYLLRIVMKNLRIRLFAHILLQVTPLRRWLMFLVQKSQAVTASSNSIHCLYMWRFIWPEIATIFEIHIWLNHVLKFVHLLLNMVMATVRRQTSIVIIKIFATICIALLSMFRLALISAAISLRVGVYLRVTHFSITIANT